MAIYQNHGLWRPEGKHMSFTKLFIISVSWAVERSKYKNLFIDLELEILHN